MQLRLRVYDLEVIIQSDSDRYIHLFRQMYRHFQVDDDLRSAYPTAEYTVLARDDNPWGQPVVILDGQVYLLNSPLLLEGYVYESILRSIVSRVQSHFLIHAGAVSYNGQGVIIVADASHGKTTMTLELVRRGFDFLSDEMAALGRADRQVYPFPRSLRIRPGTLERVGFPSAAVGAPVWLGKLILDIDEIKPDCLGAPVPINHIICLHDPTTLTPSPNTSERELTVLVDRLDDHLVAAVRRIDGVTEVHAAQAGGYHVLTLRALHRPAALAKIEAWCDAHQALVLDVIKRREGRPSFESSPVLEPIPSSQCALELVRRFQGGHKSALLQQEFGGNATRLFMEIATLISQANCYQLSVGSLEGMADLVCGLVNAMPSTGPAAR